MAASKNELLGATDKRAKSRFDTQLPRLGGPIEIECIKLQKKKNGSTRITIFNTGVSFSGKKTRTELPFHSRIVRKPESPAECKSIAMALKDIYRGAPNTTINEAKLSSVIEAFFANDSVEYLEIKAEITRNGDYEVTEYRLPV